MRIPGKKCFYEAKLGEESGNDLPHLSLGQKVRFLLALSLLASFLVPRTEELKLINRRMEQKELLCSVPSFLQVGCPKLPKICVFAGGCLEAVS